MASVTGSNSSLMVHGGYPDSIEFQLVVLFVQGVFRFLKIYFDIRYVLFHFRLIRNYCILFCYYSFQA